MKKPTIYFCAPRVSVIFFFSILLKMSSFLYFFRGVGHSINSTFHSMMKKLSDYYYRTKEKMRGESVTEEERTQHHFQQIHQRDPL